MKFKFLLLFGMQAVTAQNCISLKGSRNCQSLDDYSVLPSEEFGDLAALDNFLDAGKFSNTKFISAFKSLFQCPNFTGLGGRYGMSTYCAFLVEASRPKCQSQYANQNVTPLVLCSLTCSQHMTAIASFFKNSSICDANPQEAASKQRDSTIIPSSSPVNIAQFCYGLSRDPMAQNMTSCFPGIKAEFAACGFLLPEETKAYCAISDNTNNDPCCKAFAASNTDATGVLKPVNNTFVIAGIVAGVLIAIGIGYIVFQRVYSKRQRPITAYQPQPKFDAPKEEVPPPFPPAPPLNNPITAKGGNRRSSMFTAMGANNPMPAMSERGYSGAPSQGGFKVEVFEDYDAGMEDEISCRVGDIILVKEEFDDGWAIGINEVTGNQGIFPMAICEDISDLRPNRPRSQMTARTQSLLPPARY